VVVHPADQPDRELVVAVQLVVVAPVGVVADEVAPGARLRGQALDDRLQLVGDSSFAASAPGW
jgi:hypothetical protein